MKTKEKRQTGNGSDPAHCRKHKYKCKLSNKIRNHQENIVFKYLYTGAKLDQITAKFTFGFNNLPEIIQSLRSSGVEIQRDEVWTGKNTKIFLYHIKPGVNLNHRREL